MPKAKPAVITAIPVHALFISLCLSAPEAGGPVSPAPTAAELITPEQLLDRYAATQTRLGSFCIKFESIVDYEACVTQGPNRQRASDKRRVYKCGELRFDGIRSKYILEIWGDFNADWRGLARADAVYRSWLWNGRRRFTFVRKHARARGGDLVVIEDRLWADPFRVAAHGSGGELLGRLAHDEQRIETVLCGARLSLHDRPDLVAGTPCHVLDAATSNGQYTLWIDPLHGYHLARAEIARPAYERDGTAFPSLCQHLENVRFEEIAGVWVPVEADIRTDTRWPNGDYTRTREHHKRLEVLVNPDHEALGSFRTDDIVENARVYISGDSKAECTWQANRVVRQDGTVVLDCKSIDDPGHRPGCQEDGRPE